MAKRKNNAYVERLAEFKYTIESKDLEGLAPKSRKGVIHEMDGKTVIVPFKASSPDRKKAHKVRETEHGMLTLSPARQRITLCISFDRCHDSPEDFTSEFHKLITDYVPDVVKFEIEECLE